VLAGLGVCPSARTTPEQLHDSDIVVITHEGEENPVRCQG
jgi:hypothetical protein